MLLKLLNDKLCMCSNIGILAIIYSEIILLTYKLKHIICYKYTIYSLYGPNLLYVFNKWSEFTSQVVRVYLKSGPSLPGPNLPGPSLLVLLLSYYIFRKLSESNGITHYIILNLSASFYTLDHNILINVLSSIGICGTSLDWFISYLTGHLFTKLA